MRSMVAYGSFLDATADQPPKVFKEIWLAILKYGIDGIEPEGLSNTAKAAFEMARPNIDANKKRRKKTIDNNCEQLQTIANKNRQPYIDGDVDVDVDGDKKKTRARVVKPKKTAFASFEAQHTYDFDKMAFLAKPIGGSP